MQSAEQKHKRANQENVSVVAAKRGRRAFSLLNETREELNLSAESEERTTKIQKVKGNGKWKFTCFLKVFRWLKRLCQMFYLIFR